MNGVSPDSAVPLLQQIEQPQTSSESTLDDTGTDVPAVSSSDEFDINNNAAGMLSDSPSLVDVNEAQSIPIADPFITPTEISETPESRSTVDDKLLYGPYSARYYPRHRSYRLSRDELREIAESTLEALDEGVYYLPVGGGDNEQGKGGEEGGEREGKGEHVEREKVVLEQIGNEGQTEEEYGVEMVVVVEAQTERSDNRQQSEEDNMVERGVEMDVDVEEQTGNSDNGQQTEDDPIGNSNNRQHTEGGGNEEKVDVEQTENANNGRKTGGGSKEEGGEELTVEQTGNADDRQKTEEGSQHLNEADKEEIPTEREQEEEKENDETKKGEEKKDNRKLYDVRSELDYTMENTEYFGPDDERLSQWVNAQLNLGVNEEEENGIDDTGGEKRDQTEKKTRIIIGEYSTLVGARRLHEVVKTDRNEEDERGNTKEKIGVLNFASAKKPGGGFINGSQAQVRIAFYIPYFQLSSHYIQEESLARSSTLFASLSVPISKRFYFHYALDPDNAFYTHSMIYSPSVIIFRDDKGEWTAPLEVDMLTCAAVNAGDVRKQVRWEEEMKELRERVRVAEFARKRDLSIPLQVPVEVRIYEAEQVEEKTPSTATTTDGQLPGQSSEQQSAGSTQMSPIMFASDPDPSPPLQPLSLPPTSPIEVMPGTFPISVFPSYSNTHPPTSTYANQTPASDVVDPLAYAETLIAATMRERIARILYLFHTKGARHLVLGSFGTGVFQNSVDLIAEIFKDLLCEPREQEDEVQETDEKRREEKQEENGVGQVEKDEGDRPLLGSSPIGKGKFSNTFDTVMFAILGGSTVRTFQKAFEGQVGVEIDEDAQGSDVEGMRDAADFRVQDGRDRAA